MRRPCLLRKDSNSLKAPLVASLLAAATPSTPGAPVVANFEEKKQAHSAAAMKAQLDKLVKELKGLKSDEGVSPNEPAELAATMERVLTLSVIEKAAHDAIASLELLPESLDSSPKTLISPEVKDCISTVLSERLAARVSGDDLSQMEFGSQIMPKSTFVNDMVQYAASHASAGGLPEVDLEPLIASPVFRSPATRARLDEVNRIVDKLSESEAKMVESCTEVAEIMQGPVGAALVPEIDNLALFTPQNLVRLLRKRAAQKGAETKLPPRARRDARAMERVADSAERLRARAAKKVALAQTLNQMLVKMPADRRIAGGLDEWVRAIFRHSVAASRDRIEDPLRKARFDAILGPAPSRPREQWYAWPDAIARLAVPAVKRSLGTEEPAAVMEHLWQLNALPSDAVAVANEIAADHFHHVDNEEEGSSPLDTQKLPAWNESQGQWEHRDWKQAAYSGANMPVYHN